MSTADAKTLIVLRHAKAGWPDAADDHARPLAERGHAQAPAAGDWLREHDLVPDAVVCSDALRTRQTCVWVCERLGELAPTPYLDPRLYGADAARALAEKAGSLELLGCALSMLAFGTERADIELLIAAGRSPALARPCAEALARLAREDVPEGGVRVLATASVANEAPSTIAAKMAAVANQGKAK